MSADSAARDIAGAVSAREDESVAAWATAVDQLMRFTGDPIATLDPVNAADEAFVLGPVFTLTYRLLAGVRPDDPLVAADVRRLGERRDRVSARERAHAAAARLLHEGEFLAAAQAWDRVALDHPDDFMAYRFAHDVCLHIGDDTVRLPSAERAAAAWAQGTRAHGLANGMLSFALGEVGRFDEAERCGRIAVAADPDDLWARHALAHVHESTGAHEPAIEAMVPSIDRWSAQNLLCNHMWWHLAVRLLHHGEPRQALGLLDDRLVSTTAFGLADSTALLWRIELAGDALENGSSGATAGPAGGAPAVVGADRARWGRLADLWAANAQRHTCGFLDMHTALAFAAAPDHPAAGAFWAGVGPSHAGGSAYNDVTFRDTVEPLVGGLREAAVDPAAAVVHLGSVLPTLHRIGGSVLQRDIVGRTLAFAERRSAFAERAAAAAG